MGLRIGRTLACLRIAGASFMLLFPAALLAQSAVEQEGPQPLPQDVSRPRPLDDDAILRMSKAGLGDDLLLQAIRLQPGNYSTSPDDLIALKNAGVSERVISAMQAHGTGLQVRTGPAPTTAAVSESSSLSSPGVEEIGVYYRDLSAGEWVPLKLERVDFRSGGWVKSKFTNNIVKQDLNGVLDHAQSPLVLQTGTHLLIYAPEGTVPEEYELLRFRGHSNSREFRVRTGGVFHSETGSVRDEIVFTPQKIARQLYEFTLPSDIEKGEYGVLPPGSSNVRGVSGSGKIFTFSIRK